METSKKLKKYLLVQPVGAEMPPNINPITAIFLSPWDRYKSLSTWKNTETWISNDNDYLCPVISNSSCLDNELIFNTLVKNINKVHSVEYKQKTWSTLIYPWYWEIINIYDCLLNNLNRIRDSYDIVCVIKGKV
jgi:hypothetical protein